MAREHFWAYLKNQDGQPLVGSNIRTYLAGTATEATIFSLPTSAGIISGGDKVDTSLINQSTWITGASGFFEFYVGNAWSPSGYSADQQFRLKWWDHTVTPTAGADLDNLPVFDFIFPVDETDLNTSKNKMTSNQQAKNWSEHPDYTYANLIHDYNPVDYESGKDQTVNKLVSNNLMWRVNRDLNTLLTCGGDAISVTASGSLVDVQTIGTSAWIPSGSNYIANVTHNISRTRMFPIFQIYDFTTRDVYYPLNTRDLDLETIQITSNDNAKNLRMTIVGQLKSSVTVSASPGYYEFETGAVAANDGDADTAGGNFTTAGSTITIGDAAGTDYHAFFRFPGVKIPAGAKILSAHLDFLSAGTQTGIFCLVKFYFEAADNPVAPSTGADLIGRDLTTNNLNIVLGAWTNGARYEYTMTDVLQEVIDRPGWNSGQAIQCHAIEFNSDSGDYRLIDPDDTKLVVTYEQNIEYK